MSLSNVFNKLFFDRKNYKNLSNDDKKKNYFIISRYLSKKYPNLMMKFNNKNMDLSLAMDILYFEVGKEIKVDKYFKSWFWKPVTKDKILDKKDKENFNILNRVYNIDIDDMLYLIKYHKDFIKEEVNYLKKVS